MRTSILLALFRNKFTVHCMLLRVVAADIELEFPITEEQEPDGPRPSPREEDMPVDHELGE